MKVRKAYLLAALAALAALINAAAFAYYPININITGTQPVKFYPGSNAGHPDLGAGYNILVQTDDNGSSVEINIHPTYQHTYYHNITVVKNEDTDKSYYVAFRVTTPLSGWPASSVAKLLVYTSEGGYVFHVDLKTTGTSAWIGPLSAGDHYRIDFYFYYPPGNPLPSGSTASLQLIYSPENPASIPTVPPPPP